MGVRAQARPAELPLRGGSDDAAVRVHVFNTGTTAVAPTWFERPSGPLGAARGLLGRGKRLILPIPAFAIEHPSAGLLLVDTGMHADVADDAARHLGRAVAQFGAFRVSREDALPNALRARGLDPKAVRTVVMTHLHFDHASGVSQFPWATFVVTEREWHAAAGGNLLKGYATRLFDHPVAWRTVDPATGSPHGPFPHTIDLLGDGSVRLLSTPGHTLGHQSLLLRLAGGRELLLAGDAAYTRETIDRDLLPVVTHDDDLYRRSLAMLREFAAENPETTIVAGHDFPQLRSLPPVIE